MKHTLKAGSLQLLRQIVAVPGSATNIEETYLGGKLLVERFPADNLTMTQAEKDAPVEIELSLDERAFCKKAVEFSISKQYLPSGIYANDILESLEFVKKPAAPAPTA